MDSQPSLLCCGFEGVSRCCLASSFLRSYNFAKYSSPIFSPVTYFPLKQLVSNCVNGRSGDADCEIESSNLANLDIPPNHNQVGRQFRLLSVHRPPILVDHGDSTCDDKNDDMNDQNCCSRQELFLRATIVLEEQNDDGDDDHDNDNKNETIIQKNNNNKNQNDRIRVRYAGGSTYQVQTKYIHPIYDPRDPYYGYYYRRNDYLDHQQHENVHDIDLILFSSNLHRYSQHHPGCYVVPASAIVVVMVHSETDLYHKCCKIHTIPNFDHFIEIGCAEGELIQKMQQCSLLSSSSSTTTTHDDNTIHNENHEQQQQSYLILGIDKSISSIEKAKHRYSQCQFELCDIFIDPLPNRLRTLLQQEKQKQQEQSQQQQYQQQQYQQQQYQLIQEEKDKRNRVETDSGCDQMVVPAACDPFSSSSSSSSTFSTKTTGIVVAMDINGNRELLAVIQCLQLIMDQIQPRLIIVKSRELYQQLQSFS